MRLGGPPSLKAMALPALGGSRSNMQPRRSLGEVGEPYQLWARNDVHFGYRLSVIGYSRSAGYRLFAKRCLALPI
jgi:hypothetical protein